MTLPTDSSTLNVDPTNDEPFQDDQFLASLERKLNMPKPTAASETPLVDGVTPVSGVPPEIKDPLSIPPPVGPPSGRQEPQIRIENKTLKKQLADQIVELAELREKAGRYSELENSVTEFKTLAETRGEEKKKLEDAYREETTSFPADLLTYLPEVKEATDKFNTALSNLFPQYLSDPNDDSDPDIRLDFGALTEAQNSALSSYINSWEEQELYSKDSARDRAETQRAIISLMAKTLGVNPEKFTVEDFRGQDWQMLPKSHPVYSHLRAHLRKFVDERTTLNQITAEAKTKAQDSFGSIISQRTANTKKTFDGLGIGFTGDKLDAAIKEKPDSLVLQTMKALAPHEDLIKQIHINAEHEATLNGHIRPKYDFLDVTVDERTAKTQAANVRIMMRAAYAPLAEPLMQGFLRSNAELAELKIKYAESEAALSEYRNQTEPGSGGSAYDSLSTAPDADSYMSAIQQKAAAYRGR